jgi:hypothetical protein
MPVRIAVLDDHLGIAWAAGPAGAVLDVGLRRTRVRVLGG